MVLVRSSSTLATQRPLLRFELFRSSPSVDSCATHLKPCIRLNSTHVPDKTFSKQDSLPRLPVPELKASFDGWLRSLRPVIAQKYGPKNVDSELSKRSSLIEDFIKPSGVGSELQRLLKELDASSPTNWLTDTLWTPHAYHTWRAPLLIHSNWWLLFKHDPIMPLYAELVARDNSDPTVRGVVEAPQVIVEGAVEGSEKQRFFEEATEREGYADVQVKRAAWLVHRYLLFLEKLEREEIPPDTTKAGPLCMAQYARLFYITRLPLPTCDSFSPLTETPARYISVLVDDGVYELDVRAEDGRIYEPGVIERGLWGVIRDREGVEEVGRVGVLSADGRDRWAENRARLLALDPQNATTLSSLSSSIFTLSLDPYTLPSPPPSSTDPDPFLRPSVDAHVRNLSSSLAARNRWWDKALNLVVETSGRAGTSCEHSASDALIPAAAVDFVLADEVDVERFGEAVRDAAVWRRREWVLDEEMRQELEEAEGRAKEIIEDSDASQFWWNEYGTDWIKKVGKQSPDAYIQMALQLAWYKVCGHSTATYETAGTRAFKGGRTEVIRTLSDESRAFVLGMLDPAVSDQERYQLLTTAATAHNALTRASSSGKGFDRHLMGLKHMADKAGIEHPIFEDEMWGSSQQWKLSTSGLNAGVNYQGLGFGTPWPNGLGTNYQAGPYLIKFGIETKYSGPVGTTRFKKALADSLREMRRVCETVQEKMIE